MVKYEESGFLMIQNFVDNAILQLESNNSNVNITFGATS